MLKSLDGARSSRARIFKFIIFCSDVLRSVAGLTQRVARLRISAGGMCGLAFCTCNSTQESTLCWQRWRASPSKKASWAPRLVQGHPSWPFFTSETTNTERTADESIAQQHMIVLRNKFALCRNFGGACVINMRKVLTNLSKSAWPERRWSPKDGDFSDFVMS